MKKKNLTSLPKIKVENERKKKKESNNNNCFFFSIYVNVFFLTRCHFVHMDVCNK